MNDPALLADILLITHAMIILAVILPVPLIILGGILKWQWVHNNWFRHGHLAVIAFVVANTLLGNLCPLTIWENNYRIQSGRMIYDSGFIAYWFGKLVYPDLPPHIFPWLYMIFGGLIAILYFAIPPNLMKNRRKYDFSSQKIHTR